MLQDKHLPPSPVLLLLLWLEDILGLELDAVAHAFHRKELFGYGIRQGKILHDELLEVLETIVQNQ